MRLTFNRKRTWRKMEATTLKQAVIEARTVQPTKTPKKMAVLINLWLAAGCPGKTGPLKSLTQPQKAAEWLLKYFGQDTISEVNRLARLDGYVAWRKKSIRRGKGGGCTVRMDLSTLSNILHFGTKMGGNLGFNDQNLIYRGRDRYHRNITHARERRPENAEAIHALALELFRLEKTEVHGWHLFFAVFTGCRTSELMRLRRDAATDKQSGYIRWLSAAEQAQRAAEAARRGETDDVHGFLYLQRSKSGINPYADIGPEFAEMLGYFFKWHDARFGATAKSLPYFLTGTLTSGPRESFGVALGAAARRLGHPHCTPHGCRSYFATKHRRDGKRSEEIASLMGDKTVGLVDSTYADHVKGEKLHWKPKKGVPAWTLFGLKTEETLENAKE